MPGLMAESDIEIQHGGFAAQQVIAPPIDERTHIHPESLRGVALDCAASKPTSRSQNA
jgi:hypothetical protein